MSSLTSNFSKLVLISTMSLHMLSCKKEDLEQYAYVPPITVNDAWTTGTLEQASIDEELVIQAVEGIQKNEYTDIHSLLIIRNGKLVFEEYFNGFAKEDFHVLFSATKSYSSTLIGIALDKNQIPSTNTFLKDFFPTKQNLFADGRESIRLSDILSMASGLQWDEWSTSATSVENDHYKMMQAASQIDYVLSLPLQYTPGTTFTYNTGLSNLMAPIIEYSSGMSVEQFAEENLLHKLSITNYRWNTAIDDYPSTGGSLGGLEMVPRDMAKLGQLFLDNGNWNNERIVSEAWVQAATQGHIQESTAINYGYQWWNRTYFRKNGNPLVEFDAVGDGGQWVFVFPELDLVVAFTGGNYTWEKDRDLMFQPVTIVQKYILPAVN
jgi:CubicO group peptidase (beta-lactamase class C family)